MKKTQYIIVVSVFLVFNAFATISFAKTIGILSAMPAELESLKSKISHQKEVSAGIIQGKIGSHTVYATLSGIGKVNAVAQIAQKNEVPCLILRSISDKAGEKANINFQKFFEIVAINNSSLVAHLVEQLP